MKTICISISKNSLIFSLATHLILLCALQVFCTKPTKIALAKTSKVLRVIAVQKRFAQRKNQEKINSLLKTPAYRQVSFKNKRSLLRNSLPYAPSHSFTKKVLPPLKNESVGHKFNAVLPKKDYTTNGSINYKHRQYVQRNVPARRTVKLPIQLVSTTKTSPNKKSEEDLLWRAFKGKVFKKIRENRHIPSWFARRRLVVKVKVGFKLQRDGSVENLRLITPSSLKSLNEAALNSVRAGIPFPPFPDKVRKDSVAMGVTIAFR